MSSACLHDGLVSCQFQRSWFNRLWAQNVVDCVNMDISKLLKTFDGEAEGFETWLKTFMSAMRLKKLHLAFEKYADKRKADYDLADAQEQIFDILCCCLDRYSLGMICRDAQDNGVLAVDVLQRYYLRDSHQRFH